MGTCEKSVAFTVEEVFDAKIEDLGRFGFEYQGINRGGVSDAFSARVANRLVGNQEDAAVIEITDSEFVIVAQQPLLVAVTGAVATVLIDGDVTASQWCALRVPSGRKLAIEAPSVGYRTYLAISGQIQADELFGSVSDLPSLAFSNRLSVGDRIAVGGSDACSVDAAAASTMPMAKACAAFIRQRLNAHEALGILSTAEAELFVDFPAICANSFMVSPMSNAVGVRLTGVTPQRAMEKELVSRGVPIGAVEIPSDGEVIVLLRSRMITAGYAVPALICAADLDVLGQLRPGESVRFTMISEAQARRALTIQRALIACCESVRREGAAEE